MPVSKIPYDFRETGRIDSPLDSLLQLLVTTFELVKKKNLDFYFKMKNWQQ
jgi:hypothetical protein